MIDLHCHTKTSDGSLNIEDVLKLAKDIGISHLAITDHDTTLGLTEAMVKGEELGILVIPGIEISAYDYKENKRAHFLGYYIEPEHPALRKLCDPINEKRHQVSLLMIEKIIKAGYKITLEEVEKFTMSGTGIYKQHIMHALMEKGYCDHINAPLKKHLFSRGEENKEPGIVYIPNQYVEAEDAIEAIRKAGGVPVLAHPGTFDNFAAIPRWVEAGLEGIEVIHPVHSPDQEKKAQDLAEKFNLIMTGGSDFHGLYGEDDHYFGMGCHRIAPGVINELQQRARRIRQKNQDELIHA